MIPIVLRAVDEYGQKLALAIPRPLTTNYVARFSLQEDRGGPYCELELTNGWRFLYEHSMVTGYHGPDCLFGSEQRPILLRGFLGKWNVTEDQAIELVRRAMAKLGYPTNLVHMDFKPKVSTPAVPGIPRYMFRWNYSLEDDSIVRSSVSAEVDADKGQLKSLHYGNIAFWHQQPPIDVPIVLPVTPETNAATAKPAAKPGLQPKAPQLPLTPLKLPQEKKAR